MRFGGMLVICTLLLSGLSFAQLTSIVNSASSLCQGVMSLLPVATMLMVIIGAVVYAAGQLMGAETRARANVWATAALTGSFVAMLIFSITPGLIAMIYGSEISCSAAGGGGGPPPTPNCGFTLYCAGSTPYCCDRSSCCMGYSCTTSAVTCSCGMTAC